ncbi:tRNA (adenine(37)-N6)-methyltransferase-like [Pecten maximus]|uniref:tRNA (adenine(37)-N6)-methyltransferase-like n=1 Tax=Pecten maximus TaxID=6579 RepID=UPI001457F64E|nr:tRNA (adenine(37)-N6)-methyltransferase-like [Pecten maximus]
MSKLVRMRPIGVVNSLFTYKNGTPRQPSVCDSARGSITISKEIFNTPEHSLDGIQQYSHIWIIFEFHKNNNQYTKAKVRPPRLDGRRVGLFSTRSPYRPNPIGLTLAKLERVEGAKLHISGIDILDGSPVLDIKPYIPSYDSPGTSATMTVTPTTTLSDADHLSDSSDDQVSDIVTDDEHSSKSMDDAERTNLNGQKQSKVFDIRKGPCFMETGGTPDGSELQTRSQKEVVNEEQTLADHSKVTKNSVPSEVSTTEVSTEVSSNSNIKSSQSQNDVPIAAGECETESSLPDCSIKTAQWVKEPPIDKLTVRFTITAEKQLANFSKSTEDLDHRLQFLESPKEARDAICQILTEDPRSVYRRQSCPDNLYFFVVDKVHATCWFDESLVEVVRIKPVSQVKHLQISK